MTCGRSPPPYFVAVGTDVKTARTRLGRSSSRMTLDIHAPSDRSRIYEAPRIFDAVYGPVGTCNWRRSRETDDGHTE